MIGDPIRTSSGGAGPQKPAYEVVIVGGGERDHRRRRTTSRRSTASPTWPSSKAGLARQASNIARSTTDHPLRTACGTSAAIYEHALKLWEGLEGRARPTTCSSASAACSTWRTRCRTFETGYGACRRTSSTASTPSGSIRRPWRRPARSWTCRPTSGTRCSARRIRGAAGIAPATENVAWGFARGADALGVDLIQGCEVQRIVVEGGRAVGVETSLGPISASRVALVAAGHTTVIAETAGLRLPIQTHPLQALVARRLYEPVTSTERRDVGQRSPCLMRESQAHKGELVMEAGIDPRTTPTSRAARCT